MVASSSMSTSCTRTATTGTFASSFSMTPSGVSSGSMAVGLGMLPTPAPSFGEPSGRLVVEETDEEEEERIGKEEEEEEEEEEPKHWFVRDK